MEKVIIAIDGGAGTGTSTAAEKVSQALGIPHLNTGSMYRAIAWECRRQNVDWADGDKAGEVAEQAELQYEQGTVVQINGHNVRGQLYVDGIGRGASAVSGHKRVREAMVKLQREFGEEFGVVMEGRDIGTNVFPDTPYKFYFTCEAEERVRRLQAGGRHDETVETLRQRDADDAAHEHGAFLRHDDAIEVNTTHMGPDEVVAKIVETVRSQS